MDDYMFGFYVERCKYVSEATSYLEIYSYSDSNLNTVDEHRLADHDFDNWLNRKGAFTPRALPEGVTQTAGLRLVVQQNAKQPETFAPSVLSLRHKDYIQMVESLRLPFRAIESASCCGPFFWAAIDQDEENPNLQIVYRKSDVKKKGMTRGWELILSHNLKTSITTGFIKGTPSSDIVQCLAHLKACALQIFHPLLLPMIIFSHDMSPNTDIKQRDARDWIRRIEHAVSMRTEIQDHEGYVDEKGVVDFDHLNRHLVECHSQVLWKRPKAYMQILDSMVKAMREFQSTLEEEKRGLEFRKLHKSMLARMDFYQNKLRGTESYAHITLQRLDIQRSALYNIIAQKESKLNFQMAGEQRKLAHVAARDSSAMKTISLLGAIFLPGAFIASIFSTTFFNFQFPHPTTVVSSDFYIFWVVTIPATLVVMCVWWIWETRRERMYKSEDEDLERGVGDMEADIMAMMRKRTMSKVSTWNNEKKGDSSVGGGGGIGVVGSMNGGPSGGIHFPGAGKVNKRADALTEENTFDAMPPAMNGAGKPKVRIAERDTRDLEKGKEE